jgi:hypothetical protein
MKSFIAISAAFSLALASSAALAQATLNTDVRSGASVNAPGVKMQQKGSVKGTTGASGYAPGQKMQARGSVKGTTGASGYAPGRMKSDTNVGGDVRVKTR